jgi:hypothetical protein
MRFLANLFGICLHCSFALWQFESRAQITFGAVEKGKFYHPFGDIHKLHAKLALWQFVSRAQKTVGAVEKGKINHPFGDIHKLHAKQMLCNTTVKTKTEINTEVRIILCTRAP